jgi:ribonuclease-3
MGEQCVDNGAVAPVAGDAAPPALTPEEWAEQRLGIRLADPALLEAALTHRSARAKTSYERLEFLGDRVLGLVMADNLYARFPGDPEGEMTRRLHKLVSRETCATVARTLGVGAMVRMDAQARSDGGTDSDNILGDVVEALIGAVWLDQGWDATAATVQRWWGELPLTLEAATKHPKSALQEWALAHGRRTPVYQLLKRKGPHHAPRFRVQLTVGELPPVEAEGASKQEAETRAAQAFLDTHGR